MGKGRDWNEEFQRLLERRNLADPANELKRTAKLRQLCEDFAAVAKKVGTTIVQELFLPPVQKTIPSVTSQVGGKQSCMAIVSMFFSLPSLHTKHSSKALSLTIPVLLSGIAGGEKYIYAPERIFFKIAVDKRGLYGGDEFIMKVSMILQHGVFSTGRISQFLLLPL